MILEGVSSLYMHGQWRYVLFGGGERSWSNVLSA